MNEDGYSDPQPITFVIERAKLQQHLSDRAQHYWNIVQELRSGVRKISPPRTIGVGKPFGAANPEMTDHEKQMQIDHGIMHARGFEFMAEHLAEDARFRISLHDAMTYELIDTPFPAGSMLAVARGGVI